LFINQEGDFILVRLRGFTKLVSVEEALDLFLNKISFKKKVENSFLNFAYNQILAEDIVAKDLPRFDRSAVDGYALKAEETVGATQFSPKIFEISVKKIVKKKEARQIWTGNSIPEGANTVVMLEHTNKINGKIEVTTQLTPFKNISKRGEDFRRGEIAIKKGVLLRPHHIGLIAAFGIEKIKVFKKLRVGILATGSELRNVGEKLEGEKIFEANIPILSSLCKEINAEPIDLGIAKDDLTEIVERIKTGLTKSDLIITTGGTSVGLFDYVPEAVNKIEEKSVIVHGVAIRPGMPTALAILKNKPIIILPGNPVAAIIGFEVFVIPLINRMLGIKNLLNRPILQAEITKNINTPLGRRAFVRLHIIKHKEKYLAYPISTHGSGIFSTMTKANGYIITNENQEGIEKGTLINVNMFDGVGEE
jgi:molybdopterin molybdotransferase